MGLDRSGPRLEQSKGLLKPTYVGVKILPLQHTRIQTCPSKWRPYLRHILEEAQRRQRQVRTQQTNLQGRPRTRTT
jgi:hypothetical protein